MPRHLYAAAFLLVVGSSLVSCSKAPDGATPAAAQKQSQGSGGPAGGGAGRGGGGAGGRRGAGGPVPVLTTWAQSKSVPVTIPAVGTAEPLITVQVRAQVTGQLSVLHLTEGQDVKKGMLLF